MGFQYLHTETWNTNLNHLGRTESFSHVKSTGQSSLIKQCGRSRWTLPTLTRMTWNWARGLWSLMRFHKMNDYIVITSKQTQKSWMVGQQALQHGNKKTSQAGGSDLGPPVSGLRGWWVYKELSLRGQQGDNIKAPGHGNDEQNPFLSHIKCIIRKKHSSSLLSS